MLSSTLESSQWKLDGGDGPRHLVDENETALQKKITTQTQKERKFKASDSLPVLTSTILENTVMICVPRFEI